MRHTEGELKQLVEEGGGIYRGLWDVPALQDRPAARFVMFDSPTTHSTLMMNVEQVHTPADVLNYIVASNKRLAEAGEEARRDELEHVEHSDREDREHKEHSDREDREHTEYRRRRGWDTET